MTSVPYWVIVLDNQFYCSPGWSSALRNAQRFYDPNTALAVATQLEGSTVRKVSS